MTLAPRSRRTMIPPHGAAFSTLLVSDLPVVADRTMTWGLNGVRYGSHAESSLAAPALHWYFAEGATHGLFDLFYLVQNPSDQAAEVDARFLRGPVGAGAPVTRHYTVGAHQRLTINADFIPGLEAADVAGEFHSTQRHADHRRARDVQEPRQRAVDGRHRRHRRHHARHQLVPGRRRHRDVLRHVRAGGQPVAGAGADPRDVPAAVRCAAGAARLRHSGAAAPDDPGRAGGSGAGRDLGLDRDHVDHGAGGGRAIDVVARRRLVRRTRHARDEHDGNGVGGRRRPERHRRPRPHVPAGGERRQPDERFAAGDSGPRRRAAHRAGLHRRADAEQPPDHRSEQRVSRHPRRARRRDPRVDGPGVRRRGHADADRRRACDVQRRQRRVLERRARTSSRLAFAESATGRA